MYVRSKVTNFLGYSTTDASAQLIDVLAGGEKSWLVFDQTPFYAEMGGQAGDSGAARIDGRTIRILNTVNDSAGRHLHEVGERLDASLRGIRAELAVDRTKRKEICKHHSAVHLLYWALRETLGSGLWQEGASITEGGIRFDFSHRTAVSAAALRNIERMVNEKIADNAGVKTYETGLGEIPEDTIGLPGKEYGDIVRVVDIGGFSRQLCGGTHVETIGEIGRFKILGESSTAAGTRRVEAVAGRAAYDVAAAHEEALAKVSARLSAGPRDVVEKLEALFARNIAMEKQLKTLKGRVIATTAAELALAAETAGGLKFLSALVAAESTADLRAIGLRTLAGLGEGVVQLGAVAGERGMFAAFCSPAAIGLGHGAGALVRSLAEKLGGKGGGDLEFAIGGTFHVGRLRQAFAPPEPRAGRSAAEASEAASPPNHE